MEPEQRRSSTLQGPTSMSTTIRPATKNRSESQTARSTLFVAPADDIISLPLDTPLAWPHIESEIDAQSVIIKLATFTPNVDSNLKLVATDAQQRSALWRCPPGLMQHLAMIDVLSTAAFMNDWNLRTGFIDFANPTATLGDLIFQMKQLAALAIKCSESLYVEVKAPSD